MPTPVVIREVGLRDGLQSIGTVMPTERKCAWIRDAVAAGQRHIDFASFVSPRALPQMADAAEVLAYAKRFPELIVSVLVPNVVGAERALDGKPDSMLFPLSASHAHSLANLRKTPDEVLRLVQALLDAGADRVSLADSVGYADPLAVSRLFERARRIATGCGLPTSTIRGGWHWPTCWRRSTSASPHSTPRSPASAAARHRPAPPATSPPKTWCT